MSYNLIRTLIKLIPGSFSLVGYIGHYQYNIRKIINNGSKTYVKLLQRPYLYYKYGKQA